MNNRTDQLTVTVEFFNKQIQSIWNPKVERTII